MTRSSSTHFPAWICFQKIRSSASAPVASENARAGRSLAMVQAIPSIKERSSGAMASLGRMREIVPQDLRMSSGLKPGLNWARMSPLKPRPFKAHPLGENSLNADPLKHRSTHAEWQMGFAGLTGRGWHTIMKKPGDRDTRVTIKLLRQDTYDRIRPQGGRCFRAFQSLGGEYRRNAREGNCQPGSVSQRRSGSGGAQPFIEGAANCGGQAGGVCGSSGSAADEGLLSRLFFFQLRRSWGIALPLSSLFFLTVLLSGC